MTIRLKTSVPVCAGIVAVCAAAAAYASAPGAGGGSSAQPAPAPPPSRVLGRPYPQVTQEIAKFEEPAEASDALPETSVRKLAGIVDAQAPMSRLVRHGSGGAVHLVAAGDSEVCLLLEIGAATCGPMERVRSGTVIVSEEHVPGIQPGKTRVSGVLHDGSTAVTAHSPSGPVVDVPLVNNVYSAPFAEKPTSLQWRTVEGEIRKVEVP